MKNTTTTEISKKESVISYMELASLFGNLGEDALWEIRNDQVPYSVKAAENGLSVLTFETQKSSPLALCLSKSLEDTKEAGDLIESGLKKLSREQIGEFCKVGKLLGRLKGCTVLTILSLVGNDDLVVTCAGPTKEEGKYLGWITFGPDRYCRPLINSQPVYDSPEAAELAMSGVIDAAKELVLETDYNVLRLISPLMAGLARKNPNRKAETIDVDAQEQNSFAFLGRSPIL